MAVRSGQSVTIDFTTRRFDTGAKVNADSLPTGVLVVNGVDNGATVTVTNIATGRYKAAVTLPTLSIGDVVSLVISATVNSISDSERVWQDSKDVLLDASGNVTFNNTSLATVTNVTTTTNLTNLPSIPANWLTASGIAANALNGKGDWLLASSYSASPSAAAVATAVWTDLTASADFSTVGSVGLLVKTDLDAAVSSRLPTSGYTAPPTTAAIAAAVLTDTTGGDLATVGSLGYLIGHAPSWYVAPVDVSANVGAIKTQTDKLLFDGSSNVKSTPQTNVTVGSVAANAITSASIAPAALNGKGDWLTSLGSLVLAANGLDAVVVESGLNARQALALIAAAEAGKVSGAGSATITISGAGVAATRIVAAVDSFGDRTAVTITPPA